MVKNSSVTRLFTYCALSVLLSSCSSNDDSDSATDANTDSTTDATSGSTPDGSTPAAPTATTRAFTCEQTAAQFVTKGSANADLPDPMVSASCADDTVTIISNQIPDFPYIETSPGVPEVYDLEFTLPGVPTLAAAVSDIPALGAIGVAINGIPIYGATEGTGGDVLSLGAGFNECGGHNGPTGYHYHTFDVIGSDYCLFSEAEATAEPQLFGFALDGYPIYSGNTQYTSSWFLSDASLFATDTFSAHAYVEGSGDLDQCNGRTDADGNYAYYTTDSFPYTLGCYRGVVEEADEGDGPTGPGPDGPGPDGPTGPPPAQ